MGYLTTDEIAARYRVPVATVRQWRHKGYGPPGIRIGRWVRYEEAQVRAWEQAQGDQPRECA